MALVLAGFRRVVEQDRIVREGRWREGRPMLAKIERLRGQTLGFIAFGHVARAVAQRAAPFGLRLMAYDPYIEEMVMIERGVLPATLSEVLSQSDFVSMHAPATAEAHGMLKEKHFRQMKPNALFINTGRGPTVDEAALIKALEEGWIAHAALDVLEQEPPGHNNPLLRMPTGTLSAHVAPASVFQTTVTECVSSSWRYGPRARAVARTTLGRTTAAARRSTWRSTSSSRAI